MRVIGYYADFVVFPIVLTLLLVIAGRHGGEAHPLTALGLVCLGIFTWSFLEYAIHRFLLHGGGWFARDHAAHHAAPKALIGTPTWLTLSIMLGGIYLPAVLALHVGAGLMFGFGVTFGYLVYSFAHFSLHQYSGGMNGMLQRWKRLHALHHFAAAGGNFGVTSSFWDHVFGTVIRQRQAKKPALS